MYFRSMTGEYTCTVTFELQFYGWRVYLYSNLCISGLWLESIPVKRSMCTDRPLSLSTSMFSTHHSVIKYYLFTDMYFKMAGGGAFIHIFLLRNYKSNMWKLVELKLHAHMSEDRFFCFTPVNFVRRRRETGCNVVFINNREFSGVPVSPPILLSVTTFVPSPLSPFPH